MAGLGVARLGDITFGTCTNHDSPRTESGTVLIGLSNNVLANGLQCAKLGSIVMGNDSTGTIITNCASTVLVNGMPCAKMTSIFVGTYSGVIIKTSTDVFV